MVYDDKNKGKKNVAEIKSPYNLQPTDKYLRHTELDILPGTHGCLNVVSLEIKSNLILTIARPPRFHKPYL